MLDKFRNAEKFYSEFTNNEGKTTIIINNAGLIKFWASLGYRKVILEDSSYKIVKVRRNSIVSEVKEHILRDEAKDYIKHINRLDVLDEFLVKDYVTKKLFELLDVIDIKRSTGNKETGFLYFKNVALEITKDNVRQIEYEDLDGYIWEKQIIQRDIKPIDFEKSEFKKFIELIADNNPERTKSLITILGYLLHSYKDSAFTKAIIIMDTEIDIDNIEANGGTGKTIIGRAIGLVVPTLFIDGKAVKNQDKFKFSALQPHHQVIIYDDVKKDFDFESLYPLITGELQIEKKYKNAEIISFKDSPKILISSNYVVKGTGGNAEKRRKIEFEVSTYFKNVKNPFEEFGHRLFDDWTEEEWLMFDNFMIYTLQTYLAFGIIEPVSINSDFNRLKVETSTSFVSFMDDVTDNYNLY